MITYSEVKHLFKYIDLMAACSCFPDLLALKRFPNAKEITESMAAFETCFHKVPVFSLGDPSVTLAVVGDGHTPRTAALFAFRSRWDCHSIDPVLRKDYPVNRLTCHKQRIQDFPKMEAGKLVLVAVHSHAPLDVAYHKFTAKERVTIAIPCCVRQEIGRPPDMAYHDASIWSPHNLVKVWFN
jgi:hypothetical protein